MSSTFTMRALFCAPVDPSGRAPTSPFEVDITDSFTFLEELPALPLVGSGTFSLPLGDVPATGLKVLLLMVDPVGSPAAVSVSWTNAVTGNGNLTELTVAPGAPGLLLIHSGNPANGIATVSVTHSGAVTLRAAAAG